MRGDRPRRGGAREGRRRRTPRCSARRSASASPTGGSRSSRGTTEKAVRDARWQARRPPGLQARRHLRRRVRGVHAVPLLDLRGGVRGGADRSPQGHDPRRRPEPHRAGDRVRLLLRARRRSRCARPASRPSWSTATRRRSRPTTTRPTGSTSSRSRSRTCSRSSHVEKPDGRHRAVRRADAAEARRAARRAPACRSSAPRRTRSTAPRTASASPRCSRSSGCASRRTASRAPPRRRSRSRGASATRCWCAPRYVLGGRAMEIVYDDEDLAHLPARGGAGLARAAGPHRPLPRGRDRGRRRRGRPTARTSSSAASWSTSRRPASTPATRACALPPFSLAPERGRGDRAAVDRARARARRRRPDERPVRGPGRGRLRARGEPARDPHGAVRRQGDRRAAREGRRALHGRQDASRRPVRAARSGRCTSR